MGDGLEDADFHVSVMLNNVPEGMRYAYEFRCLDSSTVTRVFLTVLIVRVSWVYRCLLSTYPILVVIEVFNTYLRSI
jgi:hypothetical protein